MSLSLELHSLPMRTVEFKLDLSQSQQTKVDDGLNVQRWVWNRSLHLLEEFNAFNAWDKVGKAWVQCFPIQWEYYKDAAKQQKKARRHRPAPPSSENQSGKRKRQPAVGNDSS